MEIQGANSSGMSDASAEVRAAKLAQNQQKQEGQQTLQLLDSAATGVPTSASVDPALGAHVNTYA